MEKRKFLFMAVLLAIAIIAVQCRDDESFEQIPEMTLKKGGNSPHTEAAGNNLSYPVIWAEGVAKTLPGYPDMTPVTEGVWWYQWGTNGVDPDITPASCEPDPDEIRLDLNPHGFAYCDDGVEGKLDPNLCLNDPNYPNPELAAENPLPLAKAYLQKDANNTWQAGSADWSAAPVAVDWIDWGDNLESGDWYTRSQVRTEVVLFQDLVAPMTEYQMRHTSGWGIDEVHGMATDLADVPLAAAGTKATVYSHCARLTIQKLLVDRDDPRLEEYLVWIPGEGWTEPKYYPEPDENGDSIPFTEDLINPHIFNGSVHEGGDGPGYYSAEINVKGRIIYGYTWNVRALNDLEPVPPSNIPTAAGDYRITFSLDSTYTNNPLDKLNTFFVRDTTEIIVPLEVETAAALAEIIAEESGDEGGGTGVLDFENNLTYMDVRILERGGGGGKDK